MFNTLDDFQEGRIVYEAEKPRVWQENISGQKKLWNNPDKKFCLLREEIKNHVGIIVLFYSDYYDCHKENNS